MLNKTNLTNILVEICKNSERDFAILVKDFNDKLLYSFHAPNFSTIRDTINGNLDDLIEDINKTIVNDN